MSWQSLRSVFALSALLPALACFRYVTVSIPLTEVDCPPPDTPHARFAVRPDSAAPDAIHGIVWAAAYIGPGGPLEGAHVQLGSGGAHTRTDSLGRFRIDMVRPARHELHTRSIRYFARLDTVYVTAHAGAEVLVHLEPTPLDACPGNAMLAERRRQWYWPW